MKSYVSMEKRVCVVTGKEYETESLLLDTRLEESMERHTTTGWGVCPEAQKKIDEGFIALIGIDPNKTNISTAAGDGDKITPDKAYRTGKLAWLKKEAWERNIDAPVPDKMICFVEDGVIEHLSELAEKSKEETDENNQI